MNLRFFIDSKEITREEAMEIFNENKRIITSGVLEDWIRIRYITVIQGD